MSAPSSRGSSNSTEPALGPPRAEVAGLERPSSRYAAGQIIARKYELREPLGSGGMGALWIAHDDNLDVDVAIKLLRVELGKHADVAAQRMLNEARATAKLGHPAIVRMLDFGATDDGTPFLVMELLDGTNLGQLLDEHTSVTPIRAVQTLLPICHALATAHDKRIVHRDIKPENIVLAKLEGGRVQPKLLDFGIAKVGRSVDKRITQEGVPVGSPGYMSPEQARGKEVDFRTDLWSLCVVLYELVTGVLPFDCDDYHALLCKITEEEPVPITQLGCNDATLWAIVERGLAKKPDDRWESAHALGKALASWLAAQGVFEDICGVSLSRLWPSEDEIDDPLSEDRPSALPAIELAQKRARSAPDLTPASQRAWMTSSPTDPSGPFAPVAAPPAGSHLRFAMVLAAAVILGGVLIWRLTAGPERSDASAAAPATAAHAETPREVAPVPAPASAAPPAPEASAAATSSAIASASASAAAPPPPTAPAWRPPAKPVFKTAPPKPAPPPPRPALKPPSFD